HLLNTDEILGVRLLTIHNLYRYLEFMREIREAIETGCFDAFRKEFKENYSEIQKAHIERLDHG
ncbi:MAG: hypothetical protein AAF492_29765, partial [Verrucomicrobiota bacterium]